MPKLRRPEWRRARKIRQRARKRWPVSRSLKKIYSEPLAFSLSDALLAAWTTICERTKDDVLGGRYVENTFHFEVTPPGLR